jgi:hypothetical protein
MKKVSKQILKIIQGILKEGMIETQQGIKWFLNRILKMARNLLIIWLLITCIEYLLYLIKVNHILNIEEIENALNPEKLFTYFLTSTEKALREHSSTHFINISGVVILWISGYKEMLNMVYSFFAKQSPKTYMLLIVYLMFIFLYLKVGSINHLFDYTFYGVVYTLTFGVVAFPYLAYGSLLTFQSALKKIRKKTNRIKIKDAT